MAKIGAETTGVLIIGAGGHARVMAEAMLASGMPLAGHIAPDPDQSGMLGPHLGDDDQIAALALRGYRFALGLGFVDAAGAARRAALLGQLPEALITVIHPSAIVSPSAQLAAGSFIAAGAIVGTRTRIGRAGIINSGAVVDHDGSIAENCHIATGARLAGGVSLGRDVLIGVGATVRQAIAIGAGAIVGAGAVVVSPVASGGLVFGNPARERGGR